MPDRRRTRTAAVRGLLALAVTVLVAAPAGATVAVIPAAPDAATTLAFDFDTTQPPVSRNYINDVTANLPGFRIRPGAAAICTGRQVRRDACPRRSIVGTIRVSGQMLLNRYTFDLQLHRTGAPDRRAVAGLISTGTWLGGTEPFRGTIRRRNGALQIHLPVPPRRDLVAISVSMDRVSGFFGRNGFLQTPRRCDTGVWPATVDLAYLGAVSGAVTCTP